MRFQKILITSVVIFFILCVVLLGLDIFDIFNIQLGFTKMQMPERISATSNVAEFRYEPTDYLIENKEEVLEKVKEITRELKDKNNLNKTSSMFEIANIHMIQDAFYSYEQYMIVKYKLLNIIDDLPVLYSAIKDYDNTQLGSYFDENSARIEEIYGITNRDKFIKLANSLEFLQGNKITLAVLQNTTINFNYDNDTLKFNLDLEAKDRSANFAVKAQYYKTSDNQVTPYLSFEANQ